MVSNNFIEGLVLKIFIVILIVVLAGTAYTFNLHEKLLGTEQPSELLLSVPKDYEVGDLHNLIANDPRALNSLTYCSSKISESDYSSIVSALSVKGLEIPDFLFLCPRFIIVYEATISHSPIHVRQFLDRKVKALDSYDLELAHHKQYALRIIRQEPGLIVALTPKKQKILLDAGLIESWDFDLYSLPLEFFTPVVRSKIFELTAEGVGMGLPAFLTAEQEFLREYETRRIAYGIKEKMENLSQLEIIRFLKEKPDLQTLKDRLSKINPLYFDSAVLKEILKDRNWRDHVFEIIPAKYKLSSYDYEVLASNFWGTYETFPETLQADSRFIEYYLRKKRNLSISSPVKYENVAVALLENGEFKQNAFTTEMLCRPRVLRAFYEAFSLNPSTASGLGSQIPFKCHDQVELARLIKLRPTLIKQLKLPTEFIGKYLSNFGECRISSEFSAVENLGITHREDNIIIITDRDSCKKHSEKLASGESLSTLTSQKVYPARCGLVGDAIEPIIYKGGGVTFNSIVANTMPEVLNLVNCEESVLIEEKEKGLARISELISAQMASCVVKISYPFGNGQFGYLYFRSKSLMNKEECSSVTAGQALGFSYSQFEFGLNGLIKGLNPVQHYDNGCSFKNKSNFEVRKIWGFLGKSLFETQDSAFCDESNTNKI